MKDVTGSFIRTFVCLAIAAASLPQSTNAADSTLKALRPPAVPLVACDPYFSIWSAGDKLTDVDTTHWTGKPHRLTSVVQIDGRAFRVMGKEPAGIPALPQTSVEVLPTRTVYSFEGEGVQLTVTFMTPALPDDVEILSRPVTYVTYSARSTDRKEHSLEIYFDASGELVVNEGKQTIQSSASTPPKNAKGTVMGSVDQPILKRKGDDLRIDWGYLHLLTKAAPDVTAGLYQRSSKHTALFSDAPQFQQENEGNPVPTQADSVVAALNISLGKVGSKPVSRWLMLAYNDLYSIQYMRSNLRPFWARNEPLNASPAQKSASEKALLELCVRDYDSLKKRCESFDAELMADVRKAGGEKYTRLVALAFRQCFAAGKFVADANGQPLQFCKENHSNGCIGTSDVFYPMAPQFLLFGPTLAKSFLVPFMNYAASERWKFPFAPHDLGTYPHANGQVYGGGERTEQNQMPVEESGNLLILMAAIAQIEGHADFAGLYWKQLEQWAVYLKDKGFDPENQLCTDDFAGHLAHNVNLSVKAICALGSFAKLCDMRGDKQRAAEYWATAREFAQRWVKEADDGEKFRLAFDRPGSWSQKYNLMWDRILGLNLFPAEVARKEMNYYRKIQNDYGLPLDNRKAYTKLDWITWTATLTRNRADFEALIDPVYKFLDETPDRSPMTDWYQTRTAKKVGFTARPVVGGVFAELLYDKGLWQKWARRDKTKASNWAPLPKPPTISVIIPAADRQPAKWFYTMTEPAKDWASEKFDASAWAEGLSGFGTRETPGAVIGTVWNTSNIWLRREIEVPADQLKKQDLWLYHDEDAEVYINGVLALKTTGFVNSYDVFPLTSSARAALRPGKNLIAVHCRQTRGGQYVDLGFVAVEKN